MYGSGMAIEGLASGLDLAEAQTYAEWFVTLADPTRVRLLHAVATSPSGAIRVGDLAQALGISQSTCSHHVRRLADVGFLIIDKVGTASVVSVNQACCTGLPHAADAVMGTVAQRPWGAQDLPADVSTRAMARADLADVRRIYAEGIATDHATFETDAPDGEDLWSQWLDGHRWVAESNGQVVGWGAISLTSKQPFLVGVGDSTAYVAQSYRGRGVGKALLYRQVSEADAAGLWTLEASIIVENRAALALYRSAGFSTLAVRSRIAQLAGVWRDTVLTERKSPSV